MPDDLKYLMLIESNCNPLARSGVGAVGLWQFMEGTAREFGLTVNKYVDERYDIRKSTIAACKYLKKLMPNTAIGPPPLQAIMQDKTKSLPNFENKKWSTPPTFTSIRKRRATYFASSPLKSYSKIKQNTVTISLPKLSILQ